MSRINATSIQVDHDNVLTFQRYSTGNESPKKIVSKSKITEHLLTVEQVSALLDTDMEYGLSVVESKSRNKKYGLNQLKPQKPKPFVLLFLSYTLGTFNLLLGFAGVLSFLLQAFPISYSVNNYYLGAVLFFVVLFNSLVSSVQEAKTANVLKSFSKLISHHSMVQRNGHYSMIESKYLTIGDIVKIKQGDKVPADIRIIFAQSCKVDNSSLTGEAEPVARKNTTSSSSAMEAENLAFFGTLCVQGECVGIVIRVGEQTMIGSIASLSGTTKNLKSPLTEETNRFVNLISIIASTMGILFFGIGMAINGNLITNFTFFIGIFVSNIPQGLPATVTFMLTFAANRLINKNVLVKDIEGLDTLGAVTMICSDKTGTMTENKMTVVNLWQSLTHYFTKHGEGGKEFFEFDPNDPFLLCCRLNTKVELGANGDILGDATETGIYHFIKDYDYTYCPSNDYKKIHSIPFNSNNKYSITINKYKRAYCAFLKGAPEKVLKMCTKMKMNDCIIDLPADFDQMFNEAYAHMAKKGQRVLALAMLPIDYVANSDESVPVTDYIFLGLVGLMDPPKAKVAKAIASCQTAGIRVFMVTGDHPFTAEAIARQVGLLIGETKEQAAIKLKIPIESVSEADYDAVVIHGEQLRLLSNLAWDKILNKSQVVFARTTPKQKLEIVARCQAKGHVVAVTGDGVNDAPALKKADLGISMNKSGSDVSKEAAKMILLDDDFSSIVEGIAQGRLVFSNLKKAITYTMSHIMAENWAFLAYIIFPLPALSSALLIIMIDLFIDSVPAICFVNEPEEADLMNEAPRREIKPTTLIVSDEDAMQLQRIESFHIEDIQPEHKKSIKEKILGRVWTHKSKNEDALIDKNLLLQAYTQVGVIQMIGGTFAFFMVFYRGTTLHGVQYFLFPSELWGVQSFPINADGSYGTLARGFTHEAWTALYSEACAGYWLLIVVPQMFDIFICKSKIKNVFTPDVFRNKSHLLAIIWSMGIICMLLYTPGLMPVFQTQGPGKAIWGVAILTGLVIVGFDAVKKRLFELGYFGGVLKRPAKKIEGIRRVLTR